MRINMNLPAMLAAASAARSGARAGASMRRLSSGLRINMSKDDPAGNSISNKMSLQISGTQQASNNSMNGISIVQTAEGGLQEIHNMLQRMRELTLQAQNDTNVPEDRELIHMEILQLSQAITQMATDTQFNAINLLAQHTFGVWEESSPAAGATHLPNDGRANIFVEAENGDYEWDPTANAGAGGFVLAIGGPGTGTHNEIANDGRHFILADPGDEATHRLRVEEPALLVQIGPNMDQQIRMTLVDARSHNIGLRDASGNFDINNGHYHIAHIGANMESFIADDEDGFIFRNNTLSAVDAAIRQISEMRSTFGAYQNRLEHTVTNLNVMDEMLQTARMRIRDADMAFEMTELSIARIIEQAGMAILAQANMRPQQVLQLLN